MAVPKQEDTSRDQAERDEASAHQRRRAAWDKSPMRRFVKVGLYIVFASNLAIWAYYLFPFDTVRGNGVCEAVTTSKYESPAPSADEPSLGATAIPSPSPPNSSPGVLAEAPVPRLTEQTRTLTCKQPAPSSVLIVAAVVLGLFLVPELLVTFGSLRVNTPAGEFAADVGSDDRWDFIHNKAVEGYAQMTKEAED